ncbi:MAG: DUF371 domain-containing protein [Candidatus Bathyarchaeota archaeon]|nr:MAG: DUF371 domain-containing protein [Candidatus Bathyarchaeota archaeon]
MEIIETVDACGHENILSNHKTTFEITRKSTLTKHGDCIIAVGATKGAKDLHSKLKEAMKREDARITIIIEAGETREKIKARGSTRLLFTHPTDMVVRRSNYVCGRTIAVKANKTAKDISRKLVEKIQDSRQKIKITFAVESY